MHCKNLQIKRKGEQTLRADDWLVILAYTRTSTTVPTFEFSSRGCSDFRFPVTKQLLVSRDQLVLRQIRSKSCLELQHIERSANTRNSEDIIISIMFHTSVNLSATM